MTVNGTSQICYRDGQNLQSGKPLAILIHSSPFIFTMHTLAYHFAATLGVLLFNENKVDEMCKMLDELHNYVPANPFNRNLFYLMVRFSP